MSTTTTELLARQYPAVISTAQIAEIFGHHVQTVRLMIKSGRLPFENVALTPTDYRFKLSDVIEYLDSPPTLPRKSRRGRPVGSRNKAHAAQ